MSKRRSDFKSERRQQQKHKKRHGMQVRGRSIKSVLQYQMG